MASNNISATLTQEDVTAMLANVDDMETKLDFLTPISSKNKRSKQLMGTGSIGYVQYGLATAKNNESILARSFSVEEYNKDEVLNGQVQLLYNRYAPFVQKLKDTLSVLGQELMEQTNEVYAAVKREAKSNGNLKAVAEEMGKRYEKSRSEEPEEAKVKPSLN